MSETQPKPQTRSRSKSQGRSRVKAQVESRGELRIESQGGARPRHHETKKPAIQGDVDETLVGKKVVIAVSVGNKVARVVGTITVMGRFWVIVDIEDSEIPHIKGTAYLNKGSVIAYMPIPDNNPGSNHDLNTKA